MKSLSILLALAVVGCAHYWPKGFATLEFSPEVDGSLTGGGIWAMDEDLFPRPVARTQVPEGRREIGFACPGTLFVDWPPTIRYRFRIGHTYVMRCENGKPVIEPRGPLPNSSSKPTPLSGAA